MIAQDEAKWPSRTVVMLPGDSQDIDCGLGIDCKLLEAQDDNDVGLSGTSADVALQQGGVPTGVVPGHGPVTPQTRTATTTTTST